MELMMVIKLSKLLLGAILILVLIEISIRVSGITNFPLYDADNRIGYIPKPNQSGSFLWIHDWQFNSLSMGTSEFKPSANVVDTLLIGDSIVLGGNPYNQSDRLGAQLQNIRGGNVWPIAAGSWGLRNELIYLNLHPDVVAATDELIFILNSGDFNEASSWACEDTHPRRYPLYATAYVVKKYLYDWSPCGMPSTELKVPSGDLWLELSQFVHGNVAKNKKITIFLYPNKEEFQDPQLARKKLNLHANALSSAGIRNIYYIQNDSRWHVDFYRDAIHPNLKGTEMLADIINRYDK